MLTLFFVDRFRHICRIALFLSLGTLKSLMDKERIKLHLSDSLNLVFNAR